MLILISFPRNWKLLILWIEAGKGILRYQGARPRERIFQISSAHKAFKCNQQKDPTQNSWNGKRLGRD